MATIHAGILGDDDEKPRFRLVLNEPRLSGRHIDQEFDSGILVLPNWTRPGFGTFAYGYPDEVVEMLERLLAQLDAAGFAGAIDFLVRRRARARANGSRPPLFAPVAYELHQEPPETSLVDATVRGSLAVDRAEATRLLADGAIQLLRFCHQQNSSGDLQARPEAPQ